MHIIIMGPPGAGKGTQALQLCERWNLQHISTGEMLAKEIADGTDFGRAYAEDMKKGIFASDEKVASLVRQRLESPGNTSGALFDGYPRTINQARLLCELMKARGEKIPLLIELSVYPAILLNRVLKRGLLHGRADDNEETFLRRMHLYRKQTVPVLDYYRYETQTQVMTVDGMLPVEAVTERINEFIESYSRVR